MIALFDRRVRKLGYSESELETQKGGTVVVRIFALGFIGCLLAASPTSAATSTATGTGWEWLPYKDAVATDATTHKPKVDGGKTPRLVISCNNLSRVTYVEWPSDLGVAMKDLTNHADITLTLDSEVRLQELWFVARPEKDVTTAISHDRSFPKRLTGHRVLAIKARGKEGKIGFSARFDISGLRTIMDAHNMPCETLPPPPISIDALIGKP